MRKVPDEAVQFQMRRIPDEESKVKPVINAV
jgi:hypothetical protein